MSKTFDALSNIPADANYRKNVEAITNHRLKVSFSPIPRLPRSASSSQHDICSVLKGWFGGQIITEQPDVSLVEEVIGIQMEEMIQDAKDELELIPQIAGQLIVAANSLA